MAGIQERRTSAWEAARDRLDWSDIQNAMRAFADEKEAHSSEFETACNCVFTALERWLAEDLANCRVVAVEEAFEDTFKRGVVDVILEILPNPEDEVYKNHPGSLMAIDWKTSRNTLGSDWRDRYIYSWQGPTYTDGIGRKYHRTPEFFQYRGIARSFETKPVLLKVENPAPSVEAQYGGLRAMRDALVDANLPVWPKNMPSACGAYGRECRYWRDCTEGKEPRFVVAPDKLFSFSSASTFLLCPEKYRRNLLEGSEDSEDTIFGNLVHIGLAAAYKQVQNWE